MQTDIKNALSACGGSIPKFNLKIYAYLYDELICFPPQSVYNVLTTKKFFNHVHNQIKMKVNIHHSHITGEIQGYAHDFCNTRVVELERSEIPCIAHNLLGFDFFYFMKGFSTTAWCSKELSAGGTNLTHLKFASIRGEIKFIDSIKYYQRSLAELTSSMEEKEIEKSRTQMDSFLKTHQYFSTIWPFLPPCKKEKILKITCEGKGAIPYEIVTGMDSFFLQTENDFWSKTEFYCELKQKAVGDDEYEDSKFIYQTLKMRNLGDLNDLYNVQDVILLSELVENRFQLMQDTYGFNPRKCNSASSLSGCIEREMSKVIIALPTNPDHVEIFEKTVTGGFSCVTTHLAFDSQILLLRKEDGTRNNDFKIIYDINGQDERVNTKILQLDENNQYGHGMTKPLPTGCIKDDPDLSWEKFNLLIESVSLQDPIGHLYIVDIKFDKENASEKQITYNEIYCSIVEKQKTIDACERSVYQLFDNYKESKNGPCSYRVTEKAHSTMLPKKCIPLYLEDLVFLIKRAGWVVTKIHSHLTFDQEPFKRNFILMNQKSRQESKRTTEKDFFKLMNNKNFGSDCRNNMDNCDFVPIFDEIGEIYSLEKYYNLVDPKINNFVSGKLIEDYVNDKFNQQFHKLNTNDPFYQIKLSSIKQEQAEGLEAAKNLEAKRKKQKKRTTLIDYFDRMNEANQNTNIKSMIEFDPEHSNSIQTVLVKQNPNVKVTSRFISVKMLMFAKVSIKSFVYDIIDVFVFPDETTKSIYEKYKIKKCYVYQNLTDTDNTSILFVFICEMNCVVDELTARKIVFEVMITSKILKRLDLSDDFWAQFNVQDKKLKKQVGLFEAENINKANVITIAVNPKEYLEEFEDYSINKKHKGLKKGTRGMNFDAYCSKLASVTEYFDNQIKPTQKIKKKRFQVKNDAMQMRTVNKIQFGQLNDKRFYFANGIVSLPYGHFLLDEI